MAKRYRKLLVQGMRKTAEETAFGSPSEIDTRAFLWTFDSLDEDHELERFFSGLPGFRSSKVVKDPLPDLTSEQHEKLLNAWVGLLDRTSSSDLLPEPAKIRRTVICAKAIGPAGVPGAIKKLVNIILVRDFLGLPKLRVSLETGPMVRIKSLQRLPEPYVRVLSQGHNGAMTFGLLWPPMNLVYQNMSSEIMLHTRTTCHLSS
jgi:hypothetical protein